MRVKSAEDESVVAFDDSADDLLVVFRQRPVAAEHADFIVIDRVKRHVVVVFICMSDQQIDAGAEVISHFHDDVQIRLYVVVFILVDRLLADAEYCSKGFLGGSLFQPEFLEILYHSSKIPPFKPIIG